MLVSAQEQLFKETFAATISLTKDQFTEGRNLLTEQRNSSPGWRQRKNGKFSFCKCFYFLHRKGKKVISQKCANECVGWIQVQPTQS